MGLGFSLVLNQRDRTMEYHELRPAGPLATQVRLLWALRGPASQDPAFEPILPDGCPELVLNLADPFERRTAGGIEGQPTLLLAGQMLGPSLIRPTGTTDLVGIRFTPWGAHRLLHTPCVELVDRIVPAEAFAAFRPGALRERLGQITSLAVRCRALADFLLAALPPAGPPPGMVVALATGGFSSVSHAARAGGCSTRHLERLSRDWTGLPPRGLVRLNRFRAAVRLLRDSAPAGPSLARVALLAGYADQPHLTREFGRLAGLTPGRFRASQGQLTSALLEQRGEETARPAESR